MPRNNPKPGGKVDWDATGNIIEPNAGRKTSGWLFSVKPPAQNFNWLWNLLSLQQFYSNAQVEDWIVIDSDADEGDYSTLTAYLADSPVAGDRLLIKEDQTVTVQTVIPSDITIKFLDGAGILCATNIATSVLQLGSNIVIESVLNVILSQTGTTDKAVEFNGDNVTGQINIENASTGILTTAFSMNSGKEGNKIDGIISNTGAGAITNKFTDNSSKASNDLIVRDLDEDNLIISHSHAAPNNLLINGCFSVFQRGATFDSGTTPANDNDTYLADRWKLLSDGDDIVDVSKDESGRPTGSKSSIKFDIETANKKFGIIQFVEGINTRKIIGGKVFLSFKAKVSGGATINNLRAAVLSWDGTEDTLTSDVVAAWGAAGVNPTLVGNWTFENIASNLELSTSYRTFKIKNIDIDTASAKNIAVFIWVDDTDATIGDIVNITDIQLEAGDKVSSFLDRDIQTEIAQCERYYEVSDGNNSIFSSDVTNALAYRNNIGFVVTKRFNPTVVLTNFGSPSNFPAATGPVSFIGAHGFSEQRVANGTGNGFFGSEWTAESEL
jgi:hypothetical protein